MCLDRVGGFFILHEGATMADLALLDVFATTASSGFSKVAYLREISWKKNNQHNALSSGDSLPIRLKVNLWGVRIEIRTLNRHY